MVTQDAKHAGYAPGKTVIGLIERFRNVGLPSPLTIKSIQRVNVSESLASRTVKTFQILGLIDQQGMPTQQFEKLRRASTAEFKPELIALLKSVYADVFEVVEPAGATLAEIQDAFRPFTPPGQRIRMVSLFLNLLEYAEYSDSLPSVRGSGGTSPAEGRLKQQSRTNRNGKADSRVPPPPFEPAAAPLAQDPSAQETNPAKEAATGSYGDMKRMYFELLLKKADSSDTIDTDLLDRIERLVGIADNSDQD